MAWGKLHAYAFAIVSRSWWGLVAAALCQLLTYVFYFAVERAFVLQTVQAAGITPDPVATAR